jgi:hypothetical protein
MSAMDGAKPQARTDFSPFGHSSVSFLWFLAHSVAYRPHWG